MARTYRTLSLSLPPEAVERLEARGRVEGKTAARIAAEVVLREVSMSVQQVDFQADEQGDSSMVVHQCIVHEPTRNGMFAREYQTISLLDITRIRGGRVDVVDVFLGGRWLEIEADFDAFKKLWECAKETTAGVR